MAENKTKPTDASVEEYIASRASEPQRADCRELMTLLERVTRQEPRTWGPSIVGCGSYRYRYESGRTGEAPLAGFAIRGRELVIRFVSHRAAPSLIVHGDADRVVPMVEGETMYAALSKAGVPASFIRIEGAGHRFDDADFTRANAEMVRWFAQHLRAAAK